MNDFIKLVTPLTVGIIWLTKDAGNTSNPHYAEIDYLLDGLLTANLNANLPQSNKVIVGQNFNRPIYVMLLSEVNLPEIQSYISLLKDLSPENDILVIDEWDGLPLVKTELKSISSNLKIIQ